jgi:hypothetical protein
MNQIEKDEVEMLEEHELSHAATVLEGICNHNYSRSELEIIIMSLLLNSYRLVLADNYSDKENIISNIEEYLR